MENVRHRPTVLCFGHDAQLLRTRLLLLRKIGCIALHATTEREFRAAFAAGPIDLVLLCQTLPAVECNGSSAFVRELYPTVRCLVMYIRNPKCSAQGNVVTLGTDVGPRVFSQTVLRMLPGPQGIHLV